jgi:hypothetical protein
MLCNRLRLYVCPYQQDLHKESLVLVAFGEFFDSKPKRQASVSMVWECNGKSVTKWIGKTDETTEQIQLEGGAEIEHVTVCPYWRCLQKPASAPVDARPCLEQRTGTFEAPLGYFKTQDKLLKMQSTAGTIKITIAYLTNPSDIELGSYLFCLP